MLYRRHLSLLALLAACTPDPEPSNPDTDVPPPGEMVASDLARDMSPDVDEATLRSLTASNRAMAFDLYGELSAEDGNLFLSPHSISVALAMTWAGAVGTTADEMAEVLHFDLPPDTLHAAFNALDLALAERSTLPAGSSGDAPTLDIVNATFGQLGYPFETPFLDVLALDYGAAMYLMDFGADPDGSRTAINDWVEQSTHDRIQDLLPPGSVTGDTRLVLANAIYFKGSWALPFAASQTSDDAFTLLDGGAATVPTLHGTVEGTYAEGDGWAMMEMPYTGHELVMTVLVPDEGRFAEIEAGLDAAFFDEAVDALETYDITLSLPKFSFRTPIDLVPAFMALGMQAPFDGSEADFSGMSATGDLYIGGIFHQGFVDVNEEGTEAAAATAVVMNDTAAGNTTELVVDRPFLFAIRDRPTGAVLFLGRVLDPRD